uniref:Mobile mystery protein A n=2 Tax=Caulobacter TaxID=75 RepID=B0T9T3_CAUSK
MDRRKSAAEARRSLDRVLAPYRALTHRRPPRGWTRAIRDAFGMTASQLGVRMGVTQPTVQKLERSEQEDTIQLGSLRRLAEALNCELVYAFVPREPLQQTYETAARAVARRELGAISHSMALEDQAVDDADEDDRLRRFIEDELDPREVWAARP